MASTSVSASSVKIEDIGRCCGCLSADRHLAPLGDNSELFWRLLGQTIDQKYYRVQLCWECIAYLKNVRKFQNRIQYSQYILQTLVCQEENTSSLSTLSTGTTELYSNDSLKEEVTYRRQKSPKNEVPPETSIQKELEKILTNQIGKIEVDIVPKEEIYDDRYSDTHVSDTDEKQTYIYPIKKRNRVYKKGFKVLEDKAKITKNEDFDIKNVEKYYDIVFLSEKEMEVVIDKRCRRKSRFGCKECRMMFNMLVHRKWHTTFKHLDRTKGPFTCIECGHEASDWPDLADHWTIHSAAYECLICHTRHIGKTQVGVHVRSHSFKYTCNKCYITFNGLCEFREHYKHLHKYFVCDACGKKTTTRGSMKSHIKNSHTVPECRFCKKVYKSQHTLDTHMRTSHPEYVYKNADAALSYCVECNKQFDGIYKYRRHLNNSAAHNNKHKFSASCPECGKEFSRRLYMRNHYRLYHLKRSNHHCAPCNKYYATAYGLRTHRARVHDKVPLPRTKLCDICHRAFTTNRVLVNHIRTHTGERPYKCGACPAAFAQRTAMLTHRRTQHKQPHQQLDTPLLINV